MLYTKLKGGDSSGDLDVDGSIVLKLDLKKVGVKV
jgi:hypothetical protein